MSRLWECWHERKEKKEEKKKENLSIPKFSDKFLFISNFRIFFNAKFCQRGEKIDGIPQQKKSIFFIIFWLSKISEENTWFA